MPTFKIEKTRIYSVIKEIENIVSEEPIDEQVPEEHIEEEE